jgi:putative transposase
MPWKECHVMDERLRFVARLLEGEKMAPLCAEFGISRKTGYKIYDRYKDCGVGAFSDRTRRPHRQANRLPAPIEATIVRLKREYPGWGAPKIREKLRQQFTGPHLPAISTVHAVLDRHGLVHRRRRRRRRATGTELSRPDQPNALWCADYKGEFMLGNRHYCYPLTITDFASRYLLTCEALSTTQETYAFTVFERTFKEFGLPHSIRTDNGVPFASAHAIYGLSKLSVWWLRLGIQIERIKPGHPQQNGRHERMHLTLKKEATKPAAANVLQQQARFDAFIDRFNRERPHQALGMKVPADLYARSARAYRGLEDLAYPFHDQRRDALWSDLLQGPEGESEPRVCGAERRGDPGRRAHLARHLHALRFRVLRRRDVQTGADRESLRPESVTYVFGMNCHPCDRNRPGVFGRGERI